MTCENNIKKELDKLSFTNVLFSLSILATKRKINAKLWTYVPFLLSQSKRKLQKKLGTERNHSCTIVFAPKSALHFAKRYQLSSELVNPRVTYMKYTILY